MCACIACVFGFKCVYMFVFADQLATIKIWIIIAYTGYLIAI